MTVAFGIGWGGHVDLATSGEVELGVGFAVFGVFLGAASWMAFAHTPLLSGGDRGNVIALAALGGHSRTLAQANAA
jgi:hypothetical protein